MDLKEVAQALDAIARSLGSMQADLHRISERSGTRRRVVVEDGGGREAASAEARHHVKRARLSIPTRPPPSDPNSLIDARHVFESLWTADQALNARVIREGGKRTTVQASRLAAAAAFCRREGITRVVCIDARTDREWAQAGFSPRDVARELSLPVCVTHMTVRAPFDREQARRLSRMLAQELLRGPTLLCAPPHWLAAPAIVGAILTLEGASVADAHSLVARVWPEPPAPPFGPVEHARAPGALLALLRQLDVKGNRDPASITSLLRYTPPRPKRRAPTPPPEPEPKRISPPPPPAAKRPRVVVRAEPPPDDPPDRPCQAPAARMPVQSTPSRRPWHEETESTDSEDAWVAPEPETHLPARTSSGRSVRRPRHLWE